MTDPLAPQFATVATVMAGLVPAIYCGTGGAQMDGTSPAMTPRMFRAVRQSFCYLILFRANRKTIKFAGCASTVRIFASRGEFSEAGIIVQRRLQPPNSLCRCATPQGILPPMNADERG
jgi:hypothetical protein